MADQNLDAESTQTLVDDVAATNEDVEIELELRSFVDQYSTRVRSHCRRFTHDSHDADDATQLTFIALAKQLRLMRSRGESLERPLAWLLQVAKRSAIDTVRARKRRRTHERAAAGQREEIAPRPQGSDLEAKIAVQQTLDTLPAPYRTPMILFYFGGQDLESIAQQLSMTTNAVSVKLHRGRAMLAKRLRARGIAVPTVILPLLLAEVVRDHVINCAGASLLTADGGATTLHASSAILCGSAMAASRDPITQTLPAASFLHLPMLQGRLTLAVAAMIVISGVSAGGSGLLKQVERFLPSLNWRPDLLNEFRNYLTDLPKFTAAVEPASKSPSAEPSAPEIALGSSRWESLHRPPVGLGKLIDVARFEGASTGSRQVPVVVLPDARSAFGHPDRAIFIPTPSPQFSFILPEPWVEPDATPLLLSFARETVAPKEMEAPAALALAVADARASGKTLFDGSFPTKGPVVWVDSGPEAWGEPGTSLGGLDTALGPTLSDTPIVIPEPSTLLLVAAAGVLTRRRRA